MALETIPRTARRFASACPRCSATWPERGLVRFAALGWASGVSRTHLQPLAGPVEASV